VTTNEGLVTLGSTGCGVSRLMHVLRKRHQLLLEFVHASPEIRLGRSDGYGLVMSRASRHLCRNPVCGYLVRACWYIVCWHCSLCPSQTFFAKYCTPFESCILSLWDCGSACNGSWELAANMPPPSRSTSFLRRSTTCSYGRTHQHAPKCSYVVGARSLMVSCSPLLRGNEAKESMKELHYAEGPQKFSNTSIGRL
jgi:hypothetical protein